MKRVGLRPVPSRQQLVGEARLHQMEASACGRLRELNQQHVEVALQRPLQCRILFELTEKRLRRCAQRRTCPWVRA